MIGGAEETGEVADLERHHAARRAERSRVGGGKGCRRRGAIEAVVRSGAEGKQAGGSVKIQPVGTGVQETVGQGYAVEDGGEFSHRIGGICRHPGGRVVGPGPDSQDERAVHRRRPTQGDARQLHQHTVVIQGEKRNRVLNLAGERNRGSAADASVAGGIP